MLTWSADCTAVSCSDASGLGAGLVREHGGRVGGEGEAHAVDEREPGIRNLPAAGRPTELLDGLDDQEHAQHPRVHVREAGAVRVERELAARRHAAALDEGAALALRAEAEILEQHE